MCRIEKNYENCLLSKDIPKFAIEFTLPLLFYKTYFSKI